MTPQGWLAQCPPPATLFEEGYWTGILGFGRYLISAEGRILSFQKRTPRIMRPMRSGKYLAVTLVGDDGRYRKEYVHRLVLEACEGPARPGHEARHLNGNSLDNRLANLAWGTRTENAADRVVHGTATIGERNPMARLSARQVELMRQMYAGGGWSFKRLAAHFNVSTMTACRAVRRKSWTQ